MPKGQGLDRDLWFLNNLRIADDSEWQASFREVAKLAYIIVMDPRRFNDPLEAELCWLRNSPHLVKTLVFSEAVDYRLRDFRIFAKREDLLLSVFSLTRHNPRLYAHTSASQSTLSNALSGRTAYLLAIVLCFSMRVRLFATLGEANQISIFNVSQLSLKTGCTFSLLGPGGAPRGRAGCTIAPRRKSRIYVPKRLRFRLFADSRRH